MIEADILFIKDDKFYNQKDNDGSEITGYELFFQLVNDFKNKFNYSIHSFSESSFSLKSNYTINLKKHSKDRYVELYSSYGTMEDFVEKYNYLKNRISKMNIL